MANIEQWAIDLSWDIIARFSSATPEGSDEALPQGFYDDFVQVACEEAKVTNQQNQGYLYILLQTVDQKLFLFWIIS